MNSSTDPPSTLPGSRLIRTVVGAGGSAAEQVGPTGGLSRKLPQVELVDDYWPPTSAEQWAAFRRDIADIVARWRRDRIGNVGARTDEICLDAVDAEDIVQELALYFYKRLDSDLRFKTLFAFRRYVFKILGQRHAELFSKERRFRELFDRLGKPPQAEQRDPEAVLQELLGLIEDARAREIFRLRYGEGLAVKAIAEKLDLSVASVSTICSQTKSLVAEGIGRETDLR